MNQNLAPPSPPGTPLAERLVLRVFLRSLMTGVLLFGFLHLNESLITSIRQCKAYWPPNEKLNKCPTSDSSPYYPQGATESTFQVGQGSTATILLDEHLYKRAKATAAKTSEEFYVDKRRFSIGGGQGFGENKQELGPLYNRHCDLLLDQFVKTQMLSHFLSQGGWE